MKYNNNRVIKYRKSYSMEQEMHDQHQMRCVSQYVCSNDALFWVCLKFRSCTLCYRRSKHMQTHAVHCGSFLIFALQLVCYLWPLVFIRLVRCSAFCCLSARTFSSPDLTILPLLPILLFQQYCQRSNVLICKTARLQTQLGKTRNIDKSNCINR